MLVYKSQIEEIEMDLVGTCNLNCPLCTRNYTHANHLEGKNIRPLEVIKKQLDGFTSLKRFFIAGAISEPTMYKWFLEFLEYLNSRNIKYELFTNGNTHNYEWWKKLGEIVPEDCIIVFTVCGSTQELHEKYRVKSNLEEILHHAKAVRESGKGNDYIQTIRFVYNEKDLESPEMAKIINEFSNHMPVDTEGIRRNNDYNAEFDLEGMQPIPLRNAAIRSLFANRPKPGDDVEIQCKSLMLKKVYINQYGQVSPCYIHAENEDDWFAEEEVYDYSPILEFNYPDCFLCERKTKLFIDKLGLDFVC